MKHLSHRSKVNWKWLFGKLTHEADVNMILK